MKIPCDKHVDCDCNQLLTNYSSEDPDRFVFIAHNFGFAKVPPMNIDPGTDGCTTFASSPSTQQDADYCAERHQSGCEVNFAEPDPCQVCAPSVSQNQTSFGYSSTGTSTEIDPCCEPDAPIGCCCNDVPGNPDIPDTPPKTPDDPPDGPRLYGNAPQICELPCPDGTVYTFTVQAGYFVASSQILADRMAMSYACRQAARFRICISPFDGISCADPGLVNPDEVHQLTATSALAVTSWAIVSGSLPTGITLDTATGIMSGKPSVAGTYPFEVQATTSAGSTATRSMEWNILGFVTDADLPDATVGTAYSQQLLADGGGITFAIADGSLPDGLTMDDAGLISGTPTTAVTDQEFTVSVSDNFGHSCSQQFLITVISSSIDWSQLSWATSRSGTPPNCDGTVVPAVPGALQDNFQVNIIGGNTLCASLASVVGTINYNGPAVPIHITGTMICNPAGSHPPNNQTGQLRIDTKIGANPTIVTYLISNSPPLPPGCIAMVTGAYSVAFTIPDTGGQNCVIKVYANVVNSSAFGGNYEMDFTGTITND